MGRQNINEGRLVSLLLLGAVPALYARDEVVDDDIPPETVLIDLHQVNTVRIDFIVFEDLAQQFIIIPDRVHANAHIGFGIAALPLRNDVIAVSFSGVDPQLLGGVQFGNPLPDEFLLAASQIILLHDGIAKNGSLDRRKEIISVSLPHLVLPALGLQVLKQALILLPSQIVAAVFLQGGEADSALLNSRERILN